MIASNLALLDRAVQGAVAHELGDGNHDEATLAELGIAPMRTRTVAGLTVISNAARDAGVNSDAAALMGRLLHYRADRSLITHKLACLGIEPIAVLPLTAWNWLCDQTKLFRLMPDHTSRVRISTKVLDDAKQEALTARLKVPWLLVSFLVVPIVIVTAILLVLLAESLGGPLSFVYFAGFLSVGFFDCYMMTFLNSRQVKKREGLVEPVLRAKIDVARANKSLYGLLWPDYYEPEGIHATIQIALPTPPDEVQKTLVAAEHGRIILQLAVVGDAIELREDLGDALMRHRRRELEEAAISAYLNRDPIVFTIEGTAVAIIAQYGDFPIEQAVISQVINSEHLV